VHNAAITRDQPLVRMPAEAWDEVIRVNLRGAFLVTKHALRVMIRRRYGRLIYLSSLAAVGGSTGQCNYAASKAACTACPTRSLRPGIARSSISAGR
jgi:3-oxoacyl-[acyl-carrier protein] reductase